MVDSALPWTQKVAALAAKLGRSPGLDELSTMARSHKASKEEIDAQRLSYARAEAAFGTDAQEAAYARAVHNGDTAEIERLEREAEARVAAVDRLWEQKT